MRSTLNLDDELMRQVKQRAARLGMTMTEVIEDALARLFSEPEEPKRPFRVEAFEHARPYPVDPADENALEAWIDRAERAQPGGPR